MSKPIRHFSELFNSSETKKGPDHYSTYESTSDMIHGKLARPVAQN